MDSYTLFEPAFRPGEIGGYFKLWGEGMDNRKISDEDWRQDAPVSQDRKPDVTMAMNELERATTDLDEAWEALVHKIISVVRGEDDVEHMPVTDIDIEHSKCILSHSIRTEASAVANVANAIRHYVSRLEI